MIASFTGSATGLPLVGVSDVDLLDPATRDQPPHSPGRVVVAPRAARAWLEGTWFRSCHEERPLTEVLTVSRTHEDHAARDRRRTDHRRPARPARDRVRTQAPPARGRADRPQRRRRPRRRAPLPRPGDPRRRPGPGRLRGLVKAVRGYDPAKATDFLGYAVPTIRGELRRHFRDHGWTVRPPRSIQELQPRSRRAATSCGSGWGVTRGPTRSPTSWTSTRPPSARRWGPSGCFVPSSLDAAPEDGVPAADRLAASEPGYTRVDARVTLRPLLRDLSERERRILRLRFYDGAYPGRDRARDRRDPDAGLAAALGALRPAPRGAAGRRLTTGRRGEERHAAAGLEQEA